VIQFLEDGILLQKPAGCPDDVYHVMLGCWRRDPCERFAFERLHRHLVELADGDVGAVSAVADRAMAGTTLAAEMPRGSAGTNSVNDRQHRHQNDDSVQQQQEQQANYSAIDFTLSAT